MVQIKTGKAITNIEGHIEYISHFKEYGLQKEDGQVNKDEKMSELDEKITFCTKCFATNENGSWGTNGEWSIEDVKLKGLNCYCMNCAGHGEIIVISRRAANMIRESASWVGKRYYPNKEDFLHSLIVNDDKGTYTVKWRFESGIKVTPEGVHGLSGVSKNDAMKILSKALRLVENVENSHFDRTK